MINLEVKLDKLKEDYIDFYNFFVNTLRNSESKYKDYDDNKFKCYYYIGTYLFPSKKTKEYYTNLYEMKWDDRLEEELSKTRIILTMTAGKFGISDQRKNIPDSLKELFEGIVARKMYFEQIQLNGEENNEILDSIPNIEDIKNSIKKEIESQKEIINKFMNFNDDGGIINIKEEKEDNPHDRLRKLIENENYEQADELIKKHPELKKRDS